MGNNKIEYNEEEKRLKDSYYDLINRTLKERYDKNRNDIFNQNYSLFPKDFEKCYINQRVLVSKLAKNFISWKSYLMRGLNNLISEKENEYLWVRPLYNYISNESFPEQTRYQNLFFYQEFQILSLPKTKNEELDKIIYDLKSKDNNDKIDNLFNDKEEKIEENDFLSNIKLKISNNLMGSFISADSGSPTSSMIRKDPNIEYQYNKNKIKEYMEIFKEHISLKEHPIHLIITHFIKDFIPYINETIQDYKDNNEINEQNCQEKAKKIINQLQNFIVLIQNVIKLFYSRSISYAYFKDEKDEFLNLVSYIIFNNSEIYQKFFELFELMNTGKAKRLNDKFELFGDLLPEEIGVKDKFCLNEKTQHFMEQLKLEKKNTKIHMSYNKNKNENNENILAININGEEKILDEDNNLSMNPSMKENEIKTIKQETLKVTSDSGKLRSLTKDFSILSENKDYSKMPYGQAIEFLKKIVDFKVPLEKLIIIASVSSLITECVNNYWKDMHKFIQPSMLNIDADELMTIFMYIIYKSHMPLLFVHADFIKYFTSPTTKSTMIGYYYTTLQGCLDFLLEINNKTEFTKESI